LRTSTVSPHQEHVKPAITGSETSWTDIRLVIDTLDTVSAHPFLERCTPGTAKTTSDEMNATGDREAGTTLEPFSPA
jgi:hypothetical protein